jgi:hypothetical protein
VIHLAPDWLLVLPLAGSLLFLLLTALFYSLRDRHRRTGHERIFRCGVCRHVYVASRKSKITACPRCGEVNEAVRM